MRPGDNSMPAREVGLAVKDAEHGTSLRSAGPSHGPAGPHQYTTYCACAQRGNYLIYGI